MAYRVITRQIRIICFVHGVAVDRYRTTMKKEVHFSRKECDNKTVQGNVSGKWAQNNEKTQKHKQKPERNSHSYNISFFSHAGHYCDG